MNMIATRKLVITALALCVAAAVAPATSHAANAVRISQVYAGGGATGAATVTTYTKDYVELFNNSGAPVSVAGWVIEYASQAGNWGSAATNYFTLPAGATIPACGYLLVACGTVGTNVGPPAPLPVPNPDYTTTNMSMSATNGNVGLFSALNANVACGSELPAGVIVDKVSWGTGICPEVAAVSNVPTPFGNTAGAVRNGGGTVDTDNNSADFTVVTNPVPRNSTSPTNTQCHVDGACCNNGQCQVGPQSACAAAGGTYVGDATTCSPNPCSTPTEKQTWGSVKQIYR